MWITEVKIQQLPASKAIKMLKNSSLKSVFTTFTNLHSVIKQFSVADLGVCSFGMIWLRINDPRSLGSWYIKRNDESTLDKDSLLLLMHHDLYDLESQIPFQILTKECTYSLLAPLLEHMQTPQGLCP